MCRPDPKKAVWCVTMLPYVGSLLIDLCVFQEGFRGRENFLIIEELVNLRGVEVAGLKGAALLHPEAELRDESVAFDRMVEGQAGDDQDVTIAGVEGVGQVGRQAVELSPGVDVGHAAMRITGGDDIR